MSFENAENIIFDCPKCQKKLSVDKSRAGISARCPNCGKRIRIPAKTGSK